MMAAELRPFVGTNIETCHAMMAGKRFAAELGMAAAAGKCFYVHLNCGTGLKFDEDLAFGDADFGVAVETVYTLHGDRLLERRRRGRPAAEHRYRPSSRTRRSPAASATSTGRSRFARRGSTRTS